MMMFRETKQAIVDLLGTLAESRFRVIGYQGQSKNARELTGNNRLVQVYYSEGEFSKNTGRFKGAKTHDLTINIDMSVSAKATGDLSVLDNSAATIQQKAEALASIQTASYNADEQIDELIDIIWNILMDARYSTLKLERGEISSRWIDRIQKDTTLENGDLVVKTASMKYTCRVQETVGGDIGNEPATVTIDSNIPVADSTGGGVTNEIDNS